MRNIFNFSIKAIFIIVIFYNTDSAFGSSGIGIYGVLGTGINNASINLQNKILKNPIAYKKIDHVRSFMSYGCGFIADTNLDSEKIFNHRFKIGYDYQVSDSDENKKLHRGMISNTFGVGIYRDDLVRLWVGPMIGVGYLWGNNTYKDKNYFYYGNLIYPNSKSKVNMLNVNIGMELGINVNVVKSVTFSLGCGFRYNLYYNFDKKYINTKKRFEDYFPVMGPEGYITIAVMNRFTSVKKNEMDILKNEYKINQQKKNNGNNQNNSNKRYIPLDEPPER